MQEQSASIPKQLTPYVSIYNLTNERDLDGLEKGQGCYSEYHGTENFLYHNGQPMRFLAYLEYAPKVWRGNHIHQMKEEFLCVIKGEIEARFAFPESPQAITYLKIYKGQVLNIKPGIAHSIMSEHGAAAVEFSPQSFSQTDHIPFPFPSAP